MMPHRHTVLLVDDDADLLDAFAAILTISDVRTHAVSSGAEALHLLSGGLRPCVIFLDIRMPDMDGWKVREQLLAMPDARDIPIVLVSAETPDPDRAQQSAIAVWLQKPVGVLDLSVALTQTCAVTGERH